MNTESPHVSNRVPQRVFIIPYRNRQEEKTDFIARMQHYLRNDNDWEMFFAHQCDNRPFNRGAMKNIGFLAIKDKYPEHYQDITFIFHDVDNYPRDDGSVPYTTTPGVVSHFYGFKHTLGGMFAIKGQDFELTKGFPNLWGWGMEDNEIQDRCISAGLQIDRSSFFPINDPAIVHKSNGQYRVFSANEIIGYNRGTLDNMTSLKNLSWDVDVTMININGFDTGTLPEQQEFRRHNIKSSRVSIRRRGRGRPMVFGGKN